jgi:crotonobetainyl-CoA:carnitine CoA-transferase CaiB-like acyl-CoA transferase
MILGDLGASVIKVERPGLGDDTRAWGPPFDARGESAYFLSVNRNKLSIALDLRRENDADALRRLLENADVVVDNFLPGVLERLGFSPEPILARHPRIVWCTIGGFPESPNRPGYDFVVQAESGWMAITGSADGEPMKAGMALADVVAGKDASIAILAALVARANGRVSERRIKVTLADSARAALVNVAQNTLVSGANAKRWGNAHANLVPYQLFHAADRDIVIAIGTDEQWRACASVLGLRALANDEALWTNARRIAHRDRIITAIAREVSRRSATEWMERLRNANVPCGVVKSVLEAIADSAGASPLHGMPSSVGGSARIPPPRLDEHGSIIRANGWAVFD